MSEHLSAQTFARYRQKTLSPEELLAADDHLVDCAACRESLMDANALQDAFAALRTNLMSAGREPLEHLSYETLVAYVESTGYGVSGGMDAIDREIVESHLEICQACASEVRELRAFQTLVNTSASENYAPRSRWEKWMAAWPARRRLVPLTLGTALGAALLAAVFAIHPWQRMTEPAGELAASQHTTQPSMDAAPAGKDPVAATLPHEEDASSKSTAQVQPDHAATSGGSTPHSNGSHPAASPNKQVAANGHKVPESAGGSSIPAPDMQGANGEAPKIASTPPLPHDHTTDASPHVGSPATGGELPDAKSYVGRGGIRIANGKYEQAIADYKRATELDPASVPAWEGLSWSQYLAGKYDEALESNTEALNRSKNVNALRFRRGLIYATRDEWDSAQPEYEKALEGATRNQKSAALKEAREAQHMHSDVSALDKAIELLEAQPH